MLQGFFERSRLKARVEPVISVPIQPREFIHTLDLIVDLEGIKAVRGGYHGDLVSIDAVATKADAGHGRS